MILYQPDPDAPPEVMGFVCGDPKVGAYFGPKIFAGTPFETLPVLEAELRLEKEENFVSSTVVVDGAPPSSKSCLEPAHLFIIASTRFHSYSAKFRSFCLISKLRAKITATLTRRPDLRVNPL